MGLATISTTNESRSPCDFSMMYADTCDYVQTGLDSFGHPVSVSFAFLGILLNVLVIGVILHAMKLRQTQAQIHLLALAFSDLAFVVSCLFLAVVSWFCDPCLPCYQTVRCYPAIFLGFFFWALASFANRSLTLYITWLRARAIQNPFYQQRNQSTSLTRALGELGGYSALCTIVSFVITRLARMAITRYGVSLSRTHTAIIIGSNVVWTGVMLALATFIIIKLNSKKCYMSRAYVASRLAIKISSWVNFFFLIALFGN